MKKRIIFLITVFIFTLLISFIFINKIKERNNTNIYYEYYQKKVLEFSQENSQISNVDVCFVGDSLTDGYDVKSFYSSINVINRGIGGDRVKDVLKRFAVSVTDANPKIVVLLIGGNDVLAGHEEGYIIHSIIKMILDIQYNLPNTKIIIQSFYPLANDYAKHNFTMKSLNNKMKEVCDFFDILFVNLYDSLLDINTNELNLAYSPDNVHLNNDGYLVVTNILYPFIKELLN